MQKKLIKSVMFLSTIAVLVVSRFTQPTQIKAAVGSHLGYGDIGQQIQALDILKSNGAGSGFPVTIMTRLDTADADFERLAQKIVDNNFFAIVRIDGVCSTNQLAVDVVERANNIFSAKLNNNFIITYGNEVNNQQVECASWSTYANNYNQVDGSFSNLSPSALDWYNTDYPAADFLQATGLSSQYQNAPIRTANAYGCIGETADSCDPGSTLSQVTGMTDYQTKTSIPTSKLYLTEFSLSPGGSNPPDSDLNKVVQFIQSRAAETHAIHITPLIRNVCSNVSGQWLYYVNGKIISPSGKVIDPANCTVDSTQATTKDPNDYAMIPLILRPNKSLNDTGKLTDKLLWNMVVDQGYEVSCASPELYIDPASVGKLLDYFSDKNTEMAPGQSASAILKLDAEDSHKVDLVEAEIPIYRGSEASAQTKKTSSYEAFFGTVNPAMADPENTVVKSGVASNILNPQQMCWIKVDAMRTAHTLCEKLEDPEACKLHRSIPESNYYLYSTTSQETLEPSLLTAVETLMMQDPTVSCNELSGPWKSAYQISKNEFSEIKQALDNAPLEIDSLYRYAFVVLSPMQDWDEDCGASSIDRTDRFWYLNWNPNASSCPGTYINRPKRVPIFVAFKIPVFGTNNIESLPLQNTGVVTADALKTLDSQAKKYDLQHKDSRGDFLGEINQVRNDIWINGSNMDRLGLIVDCQGMPQCEGAHGQGVELRQALVHIINGSGMSCRGTNFEQPNTAEDIIYDLDNPNPISAVESAKDIFTPALYTQNASRTFENPFYNVNFTSSKSMRWDWKLWLTKDMAGKINSGKIPPEQKPVHENVGVHLVAPLGTDLTYIESALTALFREDQVEKLIESNIMVDVEGKRGNIPRYFPIEEAKIGYEATGTKKYRHEDCPDEEKEVCVLGICTKIKTGRKTDCATAGVKLKDDNVGLFIKGAKLGWFIRKIQENLTAGISPAADYINSCQRIEDLFLGRCGGDVYNSYVNTGPGPDSNELDCTITSIGHSQSLENTIVDNKQDFITEIQAVFPGTLMTNDLFDYAVEQSKTHNINPVLFLALGREETGWGGIGNAAVCGCLGTNDAGETISDAIINSPKSVGEATVDHQIECIAKNFDVALSCEDFLCKYSEGSIAPCTFTINPNFPNNLLSIYNNIIN